MQRSDVARRVLGEFSTEVYAHDFEAQDFVLELKGDFWMSWYINLVAHAKYFWMNLGAHAKDSA